MKWAEERTLFLANHLRTSLCRLNEKLDPAMLTIVVCDLGRVHDQNMEASTKVDFPTQCGIVTCHIKKPSSCEAFDNWKFKKYLFSKNIYIAITTPSSTLIDAIERNLPDMLRLSVHYFNTIEEIGLFCRLLYDYMQEEG